MELDPEYRPGFRERVVDSALEDLRIPRLLFSVCAWSLVLVASFFIPFLLLLALLTLLLLGFFALIAVPLFLLFLPHALLFFAHREFEPIEKMLSWFFDKIDIAVVAYFFYFARIYNVWIYPLIEKIASAWKELRRGKTTASNYHGGII